MWNQFSMYIRIYDILRNTTSIYGIILVCIITGGKTSNTGGFNVNNILFGEMPFSGCNKFVNLQLCTPSNTFLIFQKENKKPDIQCWVVVTSFTQIKALKDIYTSNQIDMQDDEI